MTLLEHLAEAIEIGFGELVLVGCRGLFLQELLGREDPTPEEMSAADVYRLRNEMLQSERIRVFSQFFSTDALKERLKFEVPTGRGGG